MRVASYATMLDRIAMTNPTYREWLTNTPADIDQLICPAWVKEALRQRRDDEQKRLKVEEIMALMATFEAAGIIRYHERATEAVGDIREWHGGSVFLPVGRTAIEIDDGKLLWCPDAGGLWYETVFVRTLSVDVLRSSRVLQRGTHQEYRMACRERLRRRLPETAAEADGPRQWFRIERPKSTG